MVTFDDVSKIIAVTLYNLIYKSEKAAYFSIDAIAKETGLGVGVAFLSSACSALVQDSYLKPSANSPSYTLTATGFKWAENLITRRDEALEKRVPRPDRIVGIGHNMPEFDEISAAFDDFFEDIRGWNGSPDNPNLHSRILQGVAAARDLWKASELKVVQVQVGILMAIQDAQIVTNKLARIVSGALLIDAIKALIKAHTGIDLDHF